MIIGFSKYGNGSGTASDAISYLTDSKDAKGTPRIPEPQTLRGDLNQIEKVIDLLPFAWRYTSGVLSFSESSPPRETENAIMDEFERTAFAGLEPDRYAIAFVKHQHAGRTEIHFLTPRVDLATGKSLNIAPPGKASRELFDTLRSKINLEHGFSDPDDPARARSIKLPSYLARIKAKENRIGQPSKQDVREAVTECLEAQVARGLVKSRDDVLAELRREGFSIPRAGKDYITIENPALGPRVRLKGRLYNEGPLVRETSDKTRDLAALQERLRELTTGRAKYHATAYRLPESTDIAPPTHAIVPMYDRTRTSPTAVAPTVGTSFNGARGSAERYCLALDNAARRFVGTARELARGSCAARDATERLGRTAHSFGERAAKASEHFRARQFDQTLIEKYGAAPSVSSDSMERGFDREMEMEAE